MEAENRMLVARGWGKGEMGSCCSAGMNFQLYKMNKFEKSAVQRVSVVNNSVKHLKLVKRVNFMLSVLTTHRKNGTQAFGGDRSVYYLDCVNCLMGLCICPNSSNSIH